MIFLLIQTTPSPVNTSSIMGALSPWTQYVQYLPADIPLPIFWKDSEREALQGTTLYPAVVAKLKSLEREFNHLKSSISSIDWCQQWLNTSVSFDDWKQVDAIYRSRALDVPGTGHAMVPCIDMANHAAGDGTIALYDTDSNGNAVLLLREGKTLRANDEITITYGDEKGACEMLFSYGFIEPGMTNARELFLDLEIEDNDPLKLAKKSMFDPVPGFKIFLRDGRVRWEGSYVWLMCINEEDGLEFRLMQKNDGGKELSLDWNGTTVSDLIDLEGYLRQSPAWDLFHLRAIVVLQSRVEHQLMYLEKTESSDSEEIRRLRELEETLLFQAYEEFEEQVIPALLSAITC